ncbi:MAG: hypothetical protein CL902_03005 [Dehalococcoidia bacterium]|jgi:hypothetical protein|nr:hypothetical protein [Dehalococcoidia bacterium]|tara:strand:- start:134 stop:430 length:297 start_codon:yes stop_codon:yes gene_type:complete
MSQKRQQQISDLFDSYLLSLLRDGRQVIGEDGSKQTIPLTAADLNIVRQRLRDCGMTAMVSEENPIGSIVREMKARGVKCKPELPRMSGADDAATRAG